MKNKFKAFTLMIAVGFSLVAFNTKNTQTPDILPVQESELIRIPSGFGMRTHPITRAQKLHTGIDYVLKEGSPVMATADGKVILVERLFTGRGNNITILHANNIKTSYCHLKDIKVKLNQSISQKDIIGTVGSSGLSTGPHLHYEIEVDGKHIDPQIFIKN